MKHLVGYSLFSLAAVSLACAQNVGFAAHPTRPITTLAVMQDAAVVQPNEIRGAFPTTLVKALDSKKLKEGDTVVCQTTSPLHSKSGLMIPSGAKVIGHVTQTQARSKGSPESTLAIAFDKIEISKSKELPMKGVLQAVGPSLGGNSGPDTGAAGGLGMGGRGGTATDTATVPPPTPDAVAGPNSGIHPLDRTGSRVLLNSESQGVLGVKNLEMNKDGVITSPGKEVKLETGTQMLIRAEISIPVQ